MLYYNYANAAKKILQADIMYLFACLEKLSELFIRDLNLRYFSKFKGYQHASSIEVTHF